jgi:hypothetical protein
MHSYSEHPDLAVTQCGGSESGSVDVHQSLLANI